jgi:aryl carrier-like protein
VPGGDILVDAKDTFDRGLDKDAVLDLHGWWRAEGSVVAQALTFEMSGSRRRSALD